MLEVYLVSVLSILLTEYGFQTRKKAMERFGGRFRWRRLIGRFLIWGALFGVWLTKVTHGWRLFLIIVVVGFVIGEISAFILRRSIQSDVRNKFPLSRPLSHFQPIIAAILPTILSAVLFYRFTEQLQVPSPLLPIMALKLVIGFISMFCWGTIVTVSLIGLVRSDQIPDEIEPHLGAGEVIGILERLFSFVLILNGGLAVIGFTVAAKAAARYPQFKNSAFAEYFLIGTLSSVGLAAVIGLLVSIA